MHCKIIRSRIRQMKKVVVIIFLLLEITAAAAQGVNVDSLKNLLAETKDVTTRILILSDLCNELARYEPGSAIELAQEGLKQAKQIHFAKGEASITIPLGVALKNVGDYANAIKRLLSNLAYADTTADLEIKLRTYIELSEAYREQGDYAEALKHSNKVIAFAKHLPREKCGLCRGWFLISALIYLETNQLASAKEYIDKANSYPPTPFKAINASVFDVAGRIQAGLKNYDSALRLYRKGIQGFLELKQPYKGLPKIYNSMAILLNTMGQKDSALFYLHKSLAISEQRKFGRETLDAKMRLAEVHESSRLDSALHYLKQANKTREVLYDQEKQRQIASYEFDIELQQQQAASAQAQFRNQVKIYALVALALVLLTVGLILWRANDRRKKAYALLEKQKAETDHQKEKVEQSMKELKATQAQLIQSEKMASLGELTVGIAHEIQNPLNFVNNFSEVSNELLQEMDNEMQEGNLDDAKAIAADIRKNLEKISHHGKRADGIVKGMLQHSRSNSGQRELTDLNALCDEYLRLAYHSYRAKDKSLHVNFETDFDSSLSKVNIVSQDIGRVVLNLINNAFYAVNDKSKMQGETYEPLITVSSKMHDGKVELRVKDNGDGVPDQIKEKIFQPFFTTKPPGQCTGLGLSLAYDIITKGHGGELKVESKEGQSCEFIILLPLSTNV